MVKIYSLEGCVPCKQAKYLLNKKNIKYEVIDFNKHRIDLVNLGFRTAPVFDIDGNKTSKLYRAVELATE